MKISRNSLWAYNNQPRASKDIRREKKDKEKKVIEINECLPNKLAIDFDMLEIELRFIELQHYRGVTAIIYVSYKETYPRKGKVKGKKRLIAKVKLKAIFNRIYECRKFFLQLLFRHFIIINTFHISSAHKIKLSLIRKRRHFLVM